MGLLKEKSRSVVGLNIEPGFVAAAEMTNGGRPMLTRAATMTLQPGLFHDGEVMEVDGLAERLKAFFTEQKLPKRVRLGVANQRVVVRVFELPAIENPEELEVAVRFQAQEELPMPLDEAVMDHRVLDRVVTGNGQRMRVLVVAVRRDTVEHLLGAVRKAGLTAEIVDLAAFAVVRALYEPFVPPAAGAAVGLGAGESAPASVGGAAGAPAVLYCYVGGVTNLAVAAGPTCLFNRVLPNGFESMTAALAERTGLTLEHARQWLGHVGLERDVENIEGDRDIVQEARLVLSNGAKRIVDEIRLSLEYYAGAVPDARRVERVVMAGPGIGIPGLTSQLEADLGLPAEARSFGRFEVSPGVLDAADGSRLTVAAGLAIDEVAP